MKRLLIVLFFLGLSNSTYSQNYAENGYEKMARELTNLENQTLKVHDIKEILIAEEMVYDFFNNNSRSLPPAFIKKCYSLLEFLDSARSQLDHLEELKERQAITALLESSELDKTIMLDDFIDTALSNIFEKKCISGRDVLALKYLTTIINSDLYSGIYAGSEFLDALKMLNTFMNTYVTNARIGNHDRTCKISVDKALEHLSKIKTTLEGIRR